MTVEIFPRGSITKLCFGGFGRAWLALAAIFLLLTSSYNTRAYKGTSNGELPKPRVLDCFSANSALENGNAVSNQSRVEGAGAQGAPKIESSGQRGSGPDSA
jgi:hypothetical protein